MAYEHDETIVRRDLELIHDASLSGQRWQATFLAMGWSSDRKYYLSGRDGRSYLVRASDQEVFARKQAEYHILILASRTGIRMQMPVEFGTLGDGKTVFTLMSWVEGEPLEGILASLSPAEQLEAGRSAGRALRKLHTIQAPSTQPPWGPRMTLKMQAKRQSYLACGIRVPGDEGALAYLNDHQELLVGRPQCLQHGDFHVGNLVYCTDRELGVIDFNRVDYGDPFEEFYKLLMFSRSASIDFARGQIDGYFAGPPPADFFPLLALYAADALLFSIAWAIPYGSKDVQKMVEIAEQVITDYDGFQTVVPRWL